MLKQEVEIVNKLGLHARASSRFTQTAGRFQCEVWVSRKDRRINGKSIMGLMMLAAAQGCVIELETNGIDEQEAMNTLVSLIQDRFGEDE
ncbi:HPr family phosphocarrier protein [Stenoxybacter acetivorans]|uniref:HPr family phosphocarrier protein n=1 Tax=Stenoxybacter acetivorans TaxID=422441 RepID=UPI00056B5C9D|nr:HPr family phosphocarrier protein [Stenoxybacter acetivorans]